MTWADEYHAMRYIGDLARIIDDQTWTLNNIESSISQLLKKLEALYLEKHSIELLLKESISKIKHAREKEGLL